MRILLSILFTMIACSLQAEPEFPLTADSKPQDGVPKGQLIKDQFVTTEGVFPGTEREVTLYLPANLDRSKPVSFMVFQDGVIYQAPVAFDNLIARQEIPPLVGVFIKPGVVPAAGEQALPRFNRSFEYDSVTDRYATFLLTELLPALEKKHGIRFSKDPNEAAICGSSSGGIAAFMVAWHRPDRFRRVYTGVGTYVGIRGADQLPVFVRKQEPKPLRVYLQSGTNDNNLYCGDWWMANQMMERSFIWAGYEVNHAWGEGGHNGKHATQVLPEALRWLWKDWQKDTVVRANVAGTSKWRGLEVVDLNSGWQKVEVPGSGNRLLLAADGQMTRTGDANGRTVRHGEKASLPLPSDAQGKGHSTILSPDQTLLYLASSDSAYVRSYSLGGDGKARLGQDFYQLDALGTDTIDAGGMSVDRDGRLYVATRQGVQVCDQAGRVNFIIATPSPAEDVCFGGKDLSDLFISCGGVIYQRPVKSRGLNSVQMQPIKPAAPRL